MHGSRGQYHGWIPCRSFPVPLPFLPRWRTDCGSAAAALVSLTMALRRPPACRAQATGVQSDTCAAVSMHLVHTALSSRGDWRLNVTGTSLVSKGNAGTTVQVSSVTTPVMRRTAQHMILRRPHAVAPERRPAGAPDERPEFQCSRAGEGLRRCLALRPFTSGYAPR